MGAIAQQEFADGSICDWETGLRAYLDCKFYPPLPDYVRCDITAALRGWNKGEITDLEELKDLCWLKSVDAVLRYLGEFINIPDY